MSLFGLMGIGFGELGAFLILSGGGALANLDPANTNAGITLSNNNLTATGNSGVVNYSNTRSLTSHSSGKYYFEVTFTTFVDGNAGVGLLNASESVPTDFLGDTDNSIGYFGFGEMFFGGAQVGTTTAAFVQGDVFTLAVDLTNQLIWIGKNGTNWNGSGTANPATGVGGISISALPGPVFAAGNVYTNGNSVTFNFGATSFAFTEPSGFVSWSSVSPPPSYIPTYFIYGF
jgi:SPRY domain